MWVLSSQQSSELGWMHLISGETEAQGGKRHGQHYPSSIEQLGYSYLGLLTWNQFPCDGLGTWEPDIAGSPPLAPGSLLSNRPYIPGRISCPSPSSFSQASSKRSVPKGWEGASCCLFFLLRGGAQVVHSTYLSNTESHPWVYILVFKNVEKWGGEVIQQASQSSNLPTTTNASSWSNFPMTRPNLSLKHVCPYHFKSGIIA